MLATVHVTMVAAGLIVELLFEGIGLVPQKRDAKIEMASVQCRCMTVLNIALLASAAALLPPQRRHLHAADDEPAAEGSQDRASARYSRFSEQHR